MSATYKKLLDEWRAAADGTRKAQQTLKEGFESYLEGCGPEPTREMVDHVQALRDAERQKLEAAMEYVRRTALAGRAE